MRPRIFRNFGTKVLSIGLAALLWGVVAGQREAERSLRVPLEYRNIPPELELLGEPASLVDVRVRGSSGVLGELRGADLVAVLDLRSARPGRRLFHLLPGDIAVPAGVKVLQATPSTLVAHLRGLGRADGARCAGSRRRARRRASSWGASPRCRPPSRSIGPASAVQKVTEATTEPVDITGATSPVRDTVTIGLPDTIARLRNPQSGLVTIEIAPAPVERTLDRVPVGLRGLAARASGDAEAGHGQRDRARRKLGGRLASRPPESSSTRTCPGSTADATIFLCGSSPPHDMTITNVAPSLRSTFASADMALRLFGTMAFVGTAGRAPLDPPTVRRIGAALVKADFDIGRATRFC